MKLIILILANDNEHYLQMQNLWRKYMNTHQNIKSYFIKYNIKNDIDIFVEGDTIYIKGNSESFIPGCLDKTIKSFEYILNNESFDYIIRTNMSSVWDLNKIYNLLLSNKFCASGVIGNDNSQIFISGAGMLFNRDICNLIIQNKNQLDYNILDDMSISTLLSKLNIIPTPLTRFEAYNYENNYENINNNLIDNHYHFRCKSNINNNITINIMSHIIKLIYV
jgi:hypothetical protein